MPTELMAWQYGASSPTPIPLEPPMPSDRYAIDPDSPPPSRGYMEEVVGLVATLEGMVLRREAQLSVAGIQMPSWSGQPQSRPPGPPWGAGPSGPFQGAGPSWPSRGAGPSRPFRGARGGPVRRRRAHVVEVEPDEEEEDAEEEEEATDRQLETFAEEGGSDSDDDDGAEIIPQKRMRRASRSRSRGL
ncbi:RNA-binding E3 ubiquitin-protein ligase MEX3C-like [Camellia sinensis]|uniref:RNA-binding E3 ubiquitin-protein ligase MEX3C-like n=1 Tax=Camellia sinensis TaxID=4442 RepID=UPI0010360DEB|nr:RNA-binding E3 ubiquitin-protein ligase MEX3C-like [Camellia sinensis]